jgi:hypothetical protein
LSAWLLWCRIPQTPEHLKTPCGKEAFNQNGLSQLTIRMLKDAFPDLEVREPAGAAEQE